ncbi:LuxR C-terminal-related transcriptional regulator [Actinoplanes sp. NPDC089786]|uniref:LuxR C-terminal-related transcriptional regulator n=1 Tax=Actinoplanes sp. NPDC089786 TaxID=3155185 RepID=UPI00344221DC
MPAAFLSRLFFAGGLPERRLARWDAATSRRLLAASVPGLPADVAAAVSDLAGGSPGALSGLAGALTPAQRRGDAPTPVTLPPHSPVATAFREILSGLPAETRKLVLVAAAAADLHPADLHAAALEAGAGLEALAPAEQSGLISTAGPVVTFTEPVTRAVAYHEAPLTARRAAHELLATTFARSGRRLPALIHRAAATAAPDEALSQALIDQSTGAPPRAAATALEHAARLTAHPTSAASSLLAAARRAWTAGQRHRATLLLRATSSFIAAGNLPPAYLPAGPSRPSASVPVSVPGLVSASAPASVPGSASVSAPASAPGPGSVSGGAFGHASSAGRDAYSVPAASLIGHFDQLAGGVARLDAEMRLRDGAATVAGDALLDHARRLGGQDVVAAAEALVLAGETRYLAGRHDRYQEIAREMAALPRPAEVGPALTLAFCHVAGLAAMFRGDHAAAFPELRRVVELADQVPQPAALIRAAMAGLLIGDGARAAALAERAVALARARHEAALVPQALEISAFADLSAGRYEAATAAALDGVALSQACGQPRLAQSLLGTLAVLAALAGDRETCRLRIREAAVRDGTGGPDQARGLCQWALAVLDLVHDRPQATLDRLRSSLVAAAGHGNVVLQVAATLHLAEAAWRCGEHEPPADAALKDAFENWAAVTGKPSWLALRSRCRALRSADEDEAEHHFREALDLHAEGDADFPRAHTELLFGRELRRRRRPGAARDHLRSALETFHLLDAHPWAEQADGELRAAGEHVERAATTAALPLTAQQERIARLVADGATNREVAARMYLSPRTVDHHLRNVFIRLGVRSRTELARLMVSA